MSAIRRWTEHAPCAICGGHDGLPKGRGVRCFGFISSDGAWARCSREDHGGDWEPSTGCHVHRLDKPCRCGIDHLDGRAASPAPIPPPAAPRIDAAEAVARIWGGTTKATGTVVETYLRGRGITTEVPPTLRFATRLWHAEAEAAFPAMVGGVQRWPGRRVEAVHRTYLDQDGRKAPATPVKKALGPCAGGAIRLAPAGPVLAITEGIETALSVLQETGLPTWAALSASGMCGLILPEPPLAAEIIIAADADTNGAGLRAAEAAAARWVREGRRVRIALPPRGDFNDLLQEGAA